MRANEIMTDLFKTTTVAPALVEFIYNHALKPTGEVIAERVRNAEVPSLNSIWKALIEHGAASEHPRAEFKTAFISNDALAQTFNELWENADSSGDGELDFSEFYSAAKKSAGFAAKPFITEDRCREAFNNIGEGNPITREQLAKTMMSEFGIDVERDANTKLAKVLSWHNNAAKYQ